MKIKTLLLTLLVLTLAACNNTMGGFGKDMQDNGQSIQNKADHNKVQSKTNSNNS